MYRLLLAQSFQLAIVVGGLLVPGSIVAYPFSMDVAESITVIYAFDGGQLLVLATFVLLSLGFLASLRAVSRLTSQHAEVVVLATAVPLVTAFVLVYPSGSTDIFQNMADARTLWRFHEWPMVTPPAAHRDDPIIQHVPPSRDVTSKYGPLSYIGAGIPAWLGGDDILTSLVCFKAYNGVLLLILATLVGWAASVLSPGRRVEATAMVAWNPLLLYEAVGNGHNDVLMSIFAVPALMLAWRRDAPASFVAMAVGAAVKFVTVLLAPVTWAWLWLNGDRRSRVLLTAFGIGGSVICVGAWALLGELILSGPGPAAGQGVVGSPISVLAYALDPWLGSSSIQLARGICFVVFGIIAMGLFVRLKRTPRSLWRAWVWTLFGIILLTATQVYPWYLMWAIPIAAIAPGTRESDAAVLSSIAGLVSYAFWPWQPVQMIRGELGPDPFYNFVFVLAFFGTPAIYLLLADRLHLPTTASLLGNATGFELDARGARLDAGRA